MITYNNYLRKNNMEQSITIGDGKVTTYEFEYKKELDVDDAIWFEGIGESITINDTGNWYWQLSKEELCTFIKLLVSHLELPLKIE